LRIIQVFQELSQSVELANATRPDVFLRFGFLGFPLRGKTKNAP
jgi:hypothetical protein